MAYKSLLIIIPAYNEEKNIGLLLEQLRALDIGENLDVLLIDDASTDRTAEIGRKNGCAVVTNVYNLGYGSGLQVGYKYAEKRGYQYLIQMDGDGQHDACNIKLLYEKLKEKNTQGREPDIVLGSRFLPGSVLYPISGVKRFAYSLFRFLIWLGTGKKIMDPTTGLQGMSRRAFSFYARYNHFDDRYPDANMLMQMLLLGFEVEEIPAIMHARTEGVSMHSGWKPVGYMFRMMFSIIAVWTRIKIFHTDVGVTDERHSS